MGNRLDNLGHVAPGTAYTAGTNAIANVVASDVINIIRITVAISVATTVIVRVGSDATGTNVTLNSGNPVVADSIFSFAFEMRSSVSFSIRFGADCTVRLLELSASDN